MNMTLELGVVGMLLFALIGAWFHRSWGRTALEPKALRFPVIVFLVVTIGLAAFQGVLPGEEGFSIYVFAVVGTLAVGFIVHLFSRKATKPGLQQLAGYFFYAATGIFFVFMTTLRHTHFLGPEAPRPSVTITDSIRPAQRAALILHAQTQLDWGDDTLTHAVTDRQFLDSVAGNQPVPTDIVGEITPPRNAFRREASDLGPGKGAIVYRFRLYNVVTGLAYPSREYHSVALDTASRRFGVARASSAGLASAAVAQDTAPPRRKEIWLPPGESYMWIDSLVMNTPDSGTARSFIIPVDPQFPVRRGPPVKYYYHATGMQRPGYWWNRSLAKWSFGHGSGWTWGNCTTHGCCES